MLLLEHAGSTSVPGLAAKPVFDIVLVVADSADESAYAPALESAGYARPAGACVEYLFIRAIQHKICYFKEAQWSLKFIPRRPERRLPE